VLVLLKYLIKKIKIKKIEDHIHTSSMYSYKTGDHHIY
jgi:hypothetical protein